MREEAGGRAAAASGHGRDGRVLVRGLPGVGQELVEPARGPAGRQLAQDIREVRQRRDAALGARADQAVQRRRATRRIVRAGEEMVFPAQRDVRELLLADIVVETQAAVLDEARERLPVVEDREKLRRPKLTGLPTARQDWVVFDRAAATVVSAGSVPSSVEKENGVTSC